MKCMSYILAIDQGTTSSRAILYSKDFYIVGIGQESFAQHFPKTDWVEHDLNEIWESVKKAIRGAIADAKKKHADFAEEKIVCIGITNQRETFGLWDRESSQPEGRAIVWQCRRSHKICESLKKQAAGRSLCKSSGLVLDPYFSGTKLRWRLENEKGLLKKAKEGKLAFGTIDTFLVWRLTGGEVHATDVSNASRTLMMNLKTQEWDKASLKTLKVPASLLPEIRSSDAFFGVTKNCDVLPNNIPITGILGDQQAALFGQECFQQGEAKATYGTGAFLLLNTGSKIVRTKNALSTVAWRSRGKTIYALETAVFIAGAAVQWLRDGLKLFEKSAEVEALSRSVADSDGVFFIPALSGLGSPHWVSDAKGLIGGLTRRSTKAHLARATLDGVAYSVAEAFLAMQKDAKTKMKKIRVDGGASQNALMMQFQSDIMQMTLEKPSDVESTARGAAYMAALGVGLVEDQKFLKGRNAIDKTYVKKMTAKEAQQKMKVWGSVVQGLLKLTSEIRKSSGSGT